MNLDELIEELTRVRDQRGNIECAAVYGESYAQIHSVRICTAGGTPCAELLLETPIWEDETILYNLAADEIQKP